MTRPLPPALMACLVLLGTGAATAADHSFTVASDSYVKRNNKGPYHDEPLLSVKNRGSNDNTRKALLHFPLPVSSHAPYEATLSLEVLSLNGDSTASVNVFGINTLSGEACRQLASGVNGYRYKSDPVRVFLDDSGDGVRNESSCIFEGQPLGTLTVKASDVNKTVTFSSAGLNDYLEQVSARTGVAVILLTRIGNSEKELFFASRENPAGSPAQLSFSNRDNLVFEGAPPPTKTEPLPQTWKGTLKVPMGAGKFVVLPQATLTVTFKDGKLDTVHGFLGAPPVFPEAGMLSAISMSQSGLEFGYDRPTTFGLSKDGIPSPLHDSRKYFFLRQTIGGVSAGMFDFSPPFGGETILALDPATSTLFGYTNQIPLIWPPIEDVALGFSHRDGLRYTPWVNWRVEESLQPFDANVYAAGTLGFSSDKWVKGPVEFGVSVYGGFYVDGDPGAFAQLHDLWMKRLASNGNATLDITLGPVGVGLELAQASVLLERDAGGSVALPRLIFAGAANTPNLSHGALPFSFKGGVDSAGNLDLGTPAASFVVLKGDIDLGASLSNVNLDGTMTLRATGASVQGDLRFAGLRVGATGTVDYVKQELTVGGGTRIKGKSNGWGIEVELEPTVTVGLYQGSPKGEITFKAKAEACYDLLIDKRCEKGLTVNSVKLDAGRLNICLKLPAGIGNVCVDDWK